MQHDAPAPYSRTANPQLLGSDRSKIAGWAIVAVAVSLASLIIMAIPALADAIQRLDDAVWDLAIRVEWTPLVVVARLLGVLGSVIVVAPVVLITGSWLWRRRRWPHLVVWVGALAASQAASFGLKLLYGRMRPPDQLMDTASWSFPSGHALTAAAVSAAAVLVWVPPGSGRRRGVFVASTVILAMAASRVYLRVHWFSDVIAGAAIGAAIGLGTAVAVEWWTRRRVLDPDQAGRL